MKVELKLSDVEDAHVIKNFWPLYMHELTEFEANSVNRHGLLGVDDNVRTLAEHGETQNAWWKEPSVLFPYLILADGRPAGFNLIAASSRLPPEIEADFVVYEFFVLHAYRGQGVAEMAAIQGFDRHRGRWEVVTYPNHRRAIAFWRRVIGSYAGEKNAGREMDHVLGRKVVFHFDNGGPGNGGR